jgi:Tol biopolymer transport system component
MSFSHDDKLVAFQSDAGSRLDLWVKPLEGGQARQVTQVQGFIGRFAFSPAADLLV